MNKMMIAAVLFAFSAGSALASNFGSELSTGNGAETQGSATAQAEPGTAVQVGKFFGGLLKAPLAVGRDVFTGFKAGISDDSQEAQEAVSVSATSGTHKAEGSGIASVAGPQGLQETLDARMASAKRSFAETCKDCGSGSALAKGHSAGSGFPRSASISASGSSISSGSTEVHSMSQHTADVQHLAKDDTSSGLSLSSLFAKVGITGK